MSKVIRNFYLHQNFVPKGLSVPALGLYTCIKSFKMCLKSYFKEIVLKLATNGQSDKGFLLTSTFVPKWLSAPAPALGLYTCLKALKYIPGPGVRWAFTGPLVFWFQVLRPYSNLSNLKIWDYFLTEDLAHGPSYDIEVTQREIHQNEDQEPVETIGQPRRKVVNGCYDNIMIQQPDNFQWQFQVGAMCVLHQSCTQTWKRGCRFKGFHKEGCKS